MWPAALRLAEMCCQKREQLRGKRVLDVGCGQSTLIGRSTAWTLVGFRWQAAPHTRPPSKWAFGACGQANEIDLPAHSLLMYI